jgi:hypothetical protein
MRYFAVFHLWAPSRQFDELVGNAAVSLAKQRATRGASNDASLCLSLQVPCSMRVLL